MANNMIDVIEASIFRNDNNEIFGFKICNHGEQLLCAAVSALTLNTVNSIDVIANEDYFCDFDEAGGFLELQVISLKDNKKAHNASLFLESLLLGLQSLEIEHKGKLKIIDKVVE